MGSAALHTPGVGDGTAVRDFFIGRHYEVAGGASGLPLSRSVRAPFHPQPGLEEHVATGEVDALKLVELELDAHVGARIRESRAVG